MSDKLRRPSSAVRRHSQVYVDVPHYKNLSGSAQSPAGSLKENTPLRPSRTNTETHMPTLKIDGTTPKKRKAPDYPNNSDSSEQNSTRTKKQKVATAPQPDSQAAATPKAVQAATTNPTEASSELYPNGYFYCHQCNRKRDRSREYYVRHMGEDWTDVTPESILCTFKNPRAKTLGERCKARYCGACLKNRYQLDMNELKSRSTSELSKKEKGQHILSDGYWFQ
jgi:hypothetical protein